MKTQSNSFTKKKNVLINDTTNFMILIKTFEIYYQILNFFYFCHCLNVIANSFRCIQKLFVFFTHSQHLKINKKFSFYFSSLQNNEKSHESCILNRNRYQNENNQSDKKISEIRRPIRGHRGQPKQF